MFYFGRIYCVAFIDLLSRPLFHRDNIDISGPAKPGTTRKMLGSPRQLENAVPTSKNPHGVWVWRQKRAAQWWGGLHSPQSTRPQRKLAGRLEMELVIYLTLKSWSCCCPNESDLYTRVPAPTSEYLNFHISKRSYIWKSLDIRIATKQMHQWY